MERKTLIAGILVFCLAVTLIAGDKPASWTEIGGITATMIPTTVTPPGVHTWYEVDPYGGKPAPHGENFFCELSVDNSISSYDAYITQTLTGIGPLIGGENGQQFIFYAVPQGAESTSDGIWVEVSDNIGGLTHWEILGGSNEWNSSSAWTLLDFGSGVTEITIKIGVLRPDGVTIGTRRYYIDSAFVHSWFSQFDWQNYKFENPKIPIVGDIDESGGSTEISELGSTSDTYTITLTAGQPTQDTVTININCDSQIRLNNLAPGQSAQIVFDSTNWSEPNMVTVTAVDDSDIEANPHESIITHTVVSSDPLYADGGLRDVTVHITDNDTRSCYDSCEPPLAAMSFWNLNDLARLSQNWLEPYNNMVWPRRALPFRAMLTIPSGYKRWDPPLTSTTELGNRFAMWSSEGFNALVYWLDCELFGSGSQRFIQLEDYSEARELSSGQVQTNINQLTWALTTASQYGLDNYLYTTHIHYTSAFASTHALPASGERCELTRAYTESVYAEFSRTYPDLDGYYGPMGESVPDKRSSWFAEAIVPGLKCTGGRENLAPKPRFIVHQWQVPLDDYIEDIVEAEPYDNTWLGLHAYNSEQIVDAKPWPFIVNWAEKTGLPTVVMIYPANIANFIFNSPEFAHEIVTEMKKIPNIQGFVYMEWSGRTLSPLFRKALAYYASTEQEYSDEPWLDILETQFGNRTAAGHFLNAYKLSARILPDLHALFYCPHDNLKRELNIPYSYLQLSSSRPYNWQTSRVRGNALVPIWHYASVVAENPGYYENRNGSEVPGGQGSIWRTDGGSSYDIIPPVHMASIRQYGQDAYDEATLGKNAATQNLTEANNMWMYMKGYMLLSKYFETKIAAATEAFIAAKSGSASRETAAQNLANQAYDEWVDFYNFCMTENPKLNDLAQYYNGEDLHEIGMGQETMADLLNEELSDKNNIDTIFGW